MITNLDVMNSIEAFFSKGKQSKALNLDSKISHIVVLLVDGMTYKQGEFVSTGIHAKLQEIRSDFPTTTAPKITSLLTGSLPGDHGILGWISMVSPFEEPIYPLPYLNLLGEPINTIKYYPIPDEITTIFERISVPSFSIYSSKLSKTQYTRRVSRGSEIIPYHSISQIPGIIEDIISSEEKSFTWIYIDELDKLNHEYGPNSRESLDFLEMLSFLLKKIREISIERDDLKIFVFPDHGHKESHPEKFIDVSWIIEEYLEGEEIIPIALEARYCVVKGKKVKSLLEELYEKGAKYKRIVLDHDQMKKWFGSVRNIKQFIGSQLILLEGNWAFLYGEEHAYASLHSGISESETRIPLITI